EVFEVSSLHLDEILCSFTMNVCRLVIIHSSRKTFLRTAESIFYTLHIAHSTLSSAREVFISKFVISKSLASQLIMK
ncbi:hypothetical protein L9F63_005547, partial [Diploptera punctata]